MIQYWTTTRNARLDLTFSPENFRLIRVFTGPPPKTCDAPASGILLAEIEVPQDWFRPAFSGIKAAESGIGGAARATGEIGHFRAYNVAGFCTVQGGAGAPGHARIIGFKDQMVKFGNGVTVQGFTAEIPA